MVTWRVHYADGSTYDDESGPVEDAPGLGVVIVAQADLDAGRELLHRKDYYYWERGRWFGCDLFGLWDYLARSGPRKVIAGRNTTYREYAALFDRARLDPDLPAKTALLIGEEPL